MTQSLSKRDVLNIDLVAFLERQGMTPVRQTRNSKFGTTLLYYSPFRNEKNPSFEVFPDTYPQKWIDRAEMDRTGTLLTLVAKMKNIPDTPGNLNEIITATAEAYGGVVFFLPQREVRHNLVEDKPKIEINKVNSIWYDSLVEYLNRRCISLDTARKFCKQVHYVKLKEDGTPSKERVDIGFPNSHGGNSFQKCDKEGGWELRMESEKKIMPDGSTYQYTSKICNAKAPSYIVEGKQTINVFEGFFDMLSCAEQKKRLGKDPLNEDYIVLNSVALADQVIKKMETIDLRNKKIKLFLDNDNAGTIATQKIMKALSDRAEVIDCRYILGNHKDLNEWHIANTKEMIEKNHLTLEKGVFVEKKTEVINQRQILPTPMMKKRRGVGI